ncbi:hypothetical protein [Streptomyces sp. CoH27]|uniref:hypothetical protein n=1 Tax=Streptomyces sp. CoH27 TaxID=2875763 RepID=UPI001CD3A468|nr:hypothetical protein [Streptomyces sp. CoH27]
MNRSDSSETPAGTAAPSAHSTVHHSARAALRHGSPHPASVADGWGIRKIPTRPEPVVPHASTG